MNKTGAKKKNKALWNGRKEEGRKGALIHNMLYDLDFSQVKVLENHRLTT